MPLLSGLKITFILTRQIRILKKKPIIELTITDIKNKNQPTYLFMIHFK